MRSLAATMLVCALGLVGGVAPAAAAAPRARVAVLGPAAASQPLQLVIPLAADSAGLKQFARAVSTPGSPQYRHYLPVAAIARRFGASLGTQTRVVGYLGRIGATDVAASPSGLFVKATMSVALAERTFGTSLASFQTASGVRFIAPAPLARASSAATNLPQALRGLALGVVGLDTEPVVPDSVPHRSASDVAGLHASAAQQPSDYPNVTGTQAGCNGGKLSGGFTPNQYLTAYNYGPLHQTGLGGQGERLAVIEIDRFNPSDIRTFARCFGLKVPPISIYSQGSPNAIPFGPESTLDVEVLDAATPNLKSLEVFESNGDAAQVDESFVAPLFTPGAKPDVVSASLGLCEPDMQNAFGRAGILTVENALEFAAAAGISVLAASGDKGSADCVDNQGNPVDQLATNYPASSQWVTAVGGTNFTLNAANQISSQVVWNDTTDQVDAGGGGFSAIFHRPPYQAALGTRDWRALPDVSMLADIGPGYAIYCTARGVAGCNGWTTVGGTSAATPLLAGGIALVDQDLRRHQRELLGFLNPLLYQIGSGAQGAQVYSDVQQFGNDVGSYIGNRQALGCCAAGPGFDEASGWGSVDLASLDRIALQMQVPFSNVSLKFLHHQRPIKRQRLSLRLACGGPCTAYGLGYVTIRGGHSFEVRTREYSFTTNGSKIVTVKFTPRQEQWLRSGLRNHHTIEAEIFGVALDSRGQVAQVTDLQVLPLIR
ncbi:MAG: S53 family peptidase [Solirubrobacteraceae bacterium]